MLSLQLCTRQGRDVQTVDSSLAVVHSDLLPLGLLWVKSLLLGEIPWGKTSSTNEWVAKFPLIQMEQDFTLRVTPTVVPDLRFSRKPCASETQPEMRALLFPRNQTKPIYATWKPTSWYPFILANANEFPVYSVLSQKSWDCLVCHIKPLRKRFCFSTSNIFMT